MTGGRSGRRSLCVTPASQWLVVTDPACLCALAVSDPALPASAPGIRPAGVPGRGPVIFPDAMMTVTAHIRMAGVRARWSATGLLATGPLATGLLATGLLATGPRASGHRGAPDDEPAGHRGHAVRRLAIDRGEQVLRRYPPDLLEAHVDAGERWLGPQHHRIPVVEADHGDVVGDTAPDPPQALGDPARDLVAAAEDRVHAAGRAQQDAGRLTPPLLAPLAIQDVIGRELRA